MLPRERRSQSAPLSTRPAKTACNIIISIETIKDSYRGACPRLSLPYSSKPFIAPACANRRGSFMRAAASILSPGCNRSLRSEFPRSSWTCRRLALRSVLAVANFARVISLRMGKAGLPARQLAVTAVTSYPSSTPSFFGQPAKCDGAHTSLPIRPSEVRLATSIWRQEGYMAPKPKPARFVFTVGMVLAMALTILTITADRDLAAPSSSAVYHPQLLLLY